MFALALDIVHIVSNCGPVLFLNPMLPAQRQHFLFIYFFYVQSELLRDLRPLCLLLFPLGGTGCSSLFCLMWWTLQGAMLCASSLLNLAVPSMFFLLTLSLNERTVFLTPAWPRRSHRQATWCWIYIQRRSFSSQEEHGFRMVTQNCVWLWRNDSDSELGLVGEWLQRNAWFSFI